MTQAAATWALRASTVVVGLWCALNITVYRPALSRLLPGDTFLYLPAAWAIAVAALSVGRLRAARPSRGEITGIALALAFALATIPTSLLQPSNREMEGPLYVEFVSLQILLLYTALPRLLSERDYRWILTAAAAAFVAGSIFLYVVNLAGWTRVLGEELPRMNERGGLFRHGVVFHRNPNAYNFQWVPAVLLALVPRATPRARALLLAGFAIVLFQLLLSFSRASTGMVLLSVAPGALWLLRHRRPWFWALLAAGAVALGVAAARSPAIADYLRLGFDLNSRERIWSDHFRHLRESGDVLWGYGYFNYWTRGWWGPHSAYLSVFFYYGVIGLVCYVLILGNALREIWKRNRARFGELEIQVLAAFLVASLLWGLVEDSLARPLIAPAFFFWLVAGMLARPPGAVSRSPRPSTRP